jgi:magnesium-transporting ATPase (P-type)
VRESSGAETPPAALTQRNALWHALPAQQVLELLETTPNGLEVPEAESRLSLCGPNRLRPPAQRGLFTRLVLQFHNVLIYVLLASAGVTSLLGHWVDTSVILGVVLINALIGFIQEGKAERALDAIRKMLSPRAIALRDGRRMEISAESLVPGMLSRLPRATAFPPISGCSKLRACASMKRCSPERRSW